MSPIDLMAQGTHRALADCGLTLRDVDGLFCATTQARTSAMSFAEYLGLPHAYTDSTIVGGSSFEVHVAHAMAAIDAGLCSVAVIAYGSTQRTVGRRAASARGMEPVRNAIPAVPAGQRLCARRLPPHARIRHHARAAGRGRGRGARSGRC